MRVSGGQARLGSLGQRGTVAEGTLGRESGTAAGQRDSATVRVLADHIAHVGLLLEPLRSGQTVLCERMHL